MQQRQLIALVFAGLAACAWVIVTVAVYSTAPVDGDTPGNPGSAALAGGLAVSALIGLVWLLADRLSVRPARKLTRGIRALLESRSADQEMPLPKHHVLGELPAAVEALTDALRASRREIHKAMQSARAHADEQKAWLEEILQGLTEGVLVCNRQHQIMLYNTAAVSIVGMPEAIGLSRPLFHVLSRPPVQHTLERLERRHVAEPAMAAELSAPFVCTSADGHRMLHGRMALIVDVRGAISGYLITLADISAEVALLAGGDALRRALTRDLRAVVGNLRAAAETVASYPDMAPEERGSFHEVILSESENLSRHLDELGREIGSHLLGRWPMADVYATDLVHCLQQRLQDAAGLQVTLVGLPLWVHGDSLSLMLALECLLRQLHGHSGAVEFDIECMLGDRRVYLDILWDGEPVRADQLEQWLDLSCGEEAGGQRLRDVLERHGSEAWSRAGRRSGQALLRLPLPAPSQPQFQPRQERLPARPEFYDFGLMREHEGSEALAARALGDISFVVFDCEMTGLQPTRGDEIISIAGVRVVKGRVLTGETFERLVDPGRPIPPASIRFHGITEEQVKGKPTIQVVLPQFKAFVGDAVLVAHNAAFDLKFISLKEAECGVRFNNPVLDTLLLSAMLDGDEEDHSLDALCDRCGITISGRHTALGDTMATAELLVRLIDRLQAKGLATFGEVMKASSMAAQLRHRGAMLDRG